MDLLLLGQRSRKKHLSVRKNIKRDEYGLEDVDDFFMETTQDRIILQEEGGLRKDNGESTMGNPDFAESTDIHDFETYQDFGNEPNDFMNIRYPASPIPLPANRDRERGRLSISPQYIDNDNNNNNNNNNDDDDDDDDDNLGVRGHRLRNRASFNYVARKIDFDNEGNRARDNIDPQLAAMSSVKSSTLTNNKPSPLKSPLPEQQKHYNFDHQLSQDDHDFGGGGGDEDFGHFENDAFDDGSYTRDEYIGSQEHGPALLEPSLQESESPEPSLPFEAKRIASPETKKSKRRRASSEELDDTEGSVSMFFDGAAADDDNEEEEEEEEEEEGDTFRNELSSDVSDTRDITFESPESEPHRGRKGKRARNDYSIPSSSYTSEYTESQQLPSPPPSGLRRSKRIKIKPLAYWRNERIVYSKASQLGDEEDDPDTTLVRDIYKLPLRQIKEVVHVPDNENWNTTRGKRGRRKNARKKQPPITVPLSPKSSEDESENVEPGTIPGSEWIKDSVLKLNVIENGQYVEQPVAYNQNGGEYIDITNGIVDSIDYKVSVLFNENQDLCSIAMLELPEAGEKQPVSMLTCNYIFNIVSGIVEVTLNDQVFVATRGCIFRVPSGNEYGFRNLGKGDAKLFFVQIRIAEIHELEEDFGGQEKEIEKVSEDIIDSATPSQTLVHNDDAIEDDDDEEEEEEEGNSNTSGGPPQTNALEDAIEDEDVPKEN
ncbi:MIF2 [Candida oxycetoniae]|uniref:MIF2 n=1 Tax=Candida oxycetoniae TaxID=497107 RepID=A0AAI9SXM7_9ASCO|nr:MIF2 [Candida oxycetoniae]KAI3404988.2 MIF2 [Candida oxycetoniae]